jgi:hypothetical protein
VDEEGETATFYTASALQAARWRKMGLPVGQPDKWGGVTFKLPVEQISHRRIRATKLVKTHSAVLALEEQGDFRGEVARAGRLTIQTTHTGSLFKPIALRRLGVPRACLKSNLEFRLKT